MSKSFSELVVFLLNLIPLIVILALLFGLAVLIGVLPSPIP